MDRKVTFYSEGTPCVGILGLPDDYKPGDKRGAVIFCHGFTGVKDKLVPLYEAQSMYAKARHPKKLVVLENMIHEDVYRGEGFEQVVKQTNAWFKEHMPAR